MIDEFKFTSVEAQKLFESERDRLFGNGDPSLGDLQRIKGRLVKALTQESMTQAQRESLIAMNLFTSEAIAIEAPSNSNDFSRMSDGSLTSFHQIVRSGIEQQLREAKISGDKQKIEDLTKQMDHLRNVDRVRAGLKPERIHETAKEREQAMSAVSVEVIRGENDQPLYGIDYAEPTSPEPED